jgi:hypothetical protein
MTRATVVVAVLLSSVFWTPPTAQASGNYGAVVEKGLRGCTTDHESRIVICFEAPGVDAQSRRVFLQVWPAASPAYGRGGTTATMRVRSVSVTAGTPGGHVHSYVARAERVLPLLECRDDFRFQAFNGTVRLHDVVSACTPR